MFRVRSANDRSLAPSAHAANDDNREITVPPPRRNNLPPILSSDVLLDRLAAGAPLILLDARSGPGAHDRYLAQHLTGALFVDLEYDLARPTNDPAHGGRHPLPPVADFAALLGRLGIGRDTPVVIYDDKSGANAAARAWWMLRAAGHDAVQVLDGGLAAALLAGVPTHGGAESPVPTTPYPFTASQLPSASIEEVARASHDGSALIIDVREAPRYRGETEPIDLVAGHIPRAVNVPFADNLGADGGFIDGASLRARYQSVTGGRQSDEIIVHCGSGVTACHTLLGFAHAGLPVPRLYVGSWSEWSRNPLPRG